MNVLRKKSVEQTLAETEESGHSLKRDLTWWDLAIMGVAVAVGAGIFSIGAQAAALPCGSGRNHQLPHRRRGMWCGRNVLCRIRVHDSGCGIRLHLHLYHRR